MSPHRTLLLLALLVMGASAAPADAQTTRLRGRVMDLNGQPVRDVRLRIVDHGEPEIFDSGEFQLQLAGQPSSVRVQLLDATRQVLYPPSGEIAVPRDPDARIQIVVDRPERDYVGDAIAARLVQLERVLGRNGVAYATSLDSLSESMRKVIAALGADTAAFRDRLEMQRKQGELKPGLLRTIDAYLLEVKDLHRAFRLVVPYAASDHDAVTTLRDAMLQYNEAYDSLSDTRSAFRSAVQAHWRPERAQVLIRDLEDVYVQAIEDIHRGYVLPLSESLLVLQLAHTPNKPRKQQIQQAVADAAAAARALEPRLNVLDARVRLLREALEHD